MAGEDFASHRAAAADRGRPAAPGAAPGSAAPLGRIRIGYAGKIAPDWGIRELLDWTETLRAEGLEVELTILGNKISGPKTVEARRAFRDEMKRRLDEVGVIRHEGLSRADALARMREMDFVWCWRPGAFERATLELSTKLVEGVASGCPASASRTRPTAGSSATTIPASPRASTTCAACSGRPPPTVPAAVVAACREGHSFATLAARLDTALAGPAPRPAPRVCFAGHDFKFIDPFVSRLKRQGWPVTRDVWRWGVPEDGRSAGRGATRPTSSFASGGSPTRSGIPATCRPGSGSWSGSTCRRSMRGPEGSRSRSLPTGWIASSSSPSGCARRR